MQEEPMVRIDEYDKGAKKIREWTVAGHMLYTWLNADNPEDKLTVGWKYFGQQDDVSKAFGSALTYSERYFLLKALGLPTDEDDPDTKQEPKEPVAMQNLKAVNEAMKTLPKVDVAKEFGGQEVKTGKTDFISKAQVGRLEAIAKKSNWSKEEVIKYIATMGFENAEEIHWKKYKEICDHIENNSIF